MLQRLSFFVEIIIILNSCTASSELCLPRFPLLQIMDALAWPTAESRILGSIPVTGLVVNRNDDKGEEE